MIDDLYREYREIELKMLRELHRLNLESYKQLIHGDIILIVFIIFIIFICGFVAIGAFIEGRIVYGFIEVALVLLNGFNGYITTKRLIKNMKRYREDKEKYCAVLEVNDGCDKNNE